MRLKNALRQLLVADVVLLFTSGKKAVLLEKLPSIWYTTHASVRKVEIPLKITLIVPNRSPEFKILDSKLSLGRRRVTRDKLRGFYIVVSGRLQ